MILIGCSPKGRHTEQHDVFFGIAAHIRDLFQDIRRFWPEAEGLHFDAWREVTLVDGYTVNVTDDKEAPTAAQLFFINLGGYRPNEFEEFHYKMIAAAPEKGAAIMQAKKTAFFRHTGFKGARAHVDDKYGVAVDDVFAIQDILPPGMKQDYRLQLSPALPGAVEDEIHLGYYRPEKVDQWAP